MMRRFSSGQPSRRSIRQTGVSLTHRPSVRLGIVPVASTLKELQDALQQAVEVENYAEAAELRDQINLHDDHKPPVLDRPELEALLKAAIKKEDYTAAASIRDQIGLLPEEKLSVGNMKDLSHKSVTTTKGITVEAISVYIPKRSTPDEDQYFFVYQIKISNTSDMIVHLRNRMWTIVDAQDNIQEVKGPGVVGQQPVILSGKEFRYMSACPLKTKIGIMEGEYECVVLDDEGEWGEVLNVKVGPFLLTTKVIGELQ